MRTSRRRRGTAVFPRGFRCRARFALATSGLSIICFFFALFLLGPFFTSQHAAFHPVRQSSQDIVLSPAAAAAEVAASRPSLSASPLNSNRLSVTSSLSLSLSLSHLPLLLYVPPLFPRCRCVSLCVRPLQGRSPSAEVVAPQHTVQGYFDDLRAEVARDCVKVTVVHQRHHANHRGGEKDAVRTRCQSVKCSDEWQAVNMVLPFNLFILLPRPPDA